MANRAIPKYNIPGGTNGMTTRGDTWPGMVWTVEEELTPSTWTPVDLTGATIRCDFELKGQKVAEFHSGTDGGITITDATGGEFEFDVIPAIDLPAGVLSGDLEITLNSGVKYTYVELVWPIMEDKSN